MFSALLGRSSAAPPPTAPAMTRAVSSDSTISVVSVDEASHAQSSSSTPPTSIGDSVSISSSSPKLAKSISTPAADLNGRSRRDRKSVGTYNVKVLSGTAIHAPKKFHKDPAIRAANEARKAEKARRRTISGNTLLGKVESGSSSTVTAEKAANQLEVSDDVEALDLHWSVKAAVPYKSPYGPALSPETAAKQIALEQSKSSRQSGEPVSSLAKKFSVLGKRSRKTIDDGVVAGLAKAKRELRNLADTNEFLKIDTAPVLHEVWSNGKLVKPESARKKKKVEEPVPAKSRATAEKLAQKPTEKPKPATKKQKAWLSKGLYAGQEADINSFNAFKDSSAKEKEDMRDIAPFRPHTFMALPMWNGQRLLQNGRDFKLPFDVCSPLLPGQPKPDEWRKTSSNRFIGEASAMWKKSSLFDSFSSKCVCTAQDGCDDDCQNRIMLYECDDTNCGAGRGRCTNRAFADLQERRKQGGKYRIGVEVIKTADRGYGVRPNRCFDANQIIVEYTGEIITEDECDRRMNEDYKNNECYYLMSFDQNMIIDATKGSIARFVNHSCKPNCRMVKWIVGGKPRMALFAGDNPIMTGEELTYDYNFDPFSAKNVQECRCGSDNCRGVLGPKPKPTAKELADIKQAKETLKAALKATVKATVKAGKRKLKELLAGDPADDDNPRSLKKRKIKEAKGVKRSASSASLQMAKGAAKAVRRTVSSQLLSVRRSVSTKRVVKKTMKAQILDTYSKSPTKVSSRNSSLTMVASNESPRARNVSGSSSRRSVHKTPLKTVRVAKASPRDLSGGTIRVVTGEEEDEDGEEEEA